MEGVARVRQRVSQKALQWDEPVRRARDFTGGAMLDRRFWIGCFIAVGMAAALVGCDVKRIESTEEGLTTEAEVRAKWGPPEAVWDGANGERVFEYNRQPEGHKNYQITIGTDGKVSALRQLLTPENFAKVQPAMPIETVRKMLGKPAEAKPYALTQEVHYNWRFMEAGTHQSKLFSVVVNPQQQVVRTEVGPDPKATENKGG
jgi:hypothetical protein